MRLGINQVLLLHRCLKRGFINSYDVKLVYGLSTSRRYSNSSNNKSRIIIEKLEFRNLISRVPDGIPWTWTLTDQGKEVLIENLPKPPNQHVGDQLNDRST